MRAKEVIVKELIIKTRTRIVITIIITIVTITITIEIRTRINKTTKEEMAAQQKIKLTTRLTRESTSSLTSSDMIENCRSCKMKLMQVLGIRYSLEDLTTI